MWHLLAAPAEATTLRRCLAHIAQALADWFDAIGFDQLAVANVCAPHQNIPAR